MARRDNIKSKAPGQTPPAGPDKPDDLTGAERMLLACDLLTEAATDPTKSAESRIEASDRYLRIALAGDEDAIAETLRIAGL